MQLGGWQQFPYKMFKSQGLRVSEQVPFGSLKLGIGIPNIMPEGVLKKGLHKGESSCEAFVKYNIPELYICQVSHRTACFVRLYICTCSIAFDGNCLHTGSQFMRQGHMGFPELHGNSG